MRTFKTAWAMLVLAMLGAAIVAPAWARQAGLQNVSKKTTVTITRPMEVPGTVLQPGTYVFKVMDIVGTRNIMQITNKAEDKVYATVIAIPDYRVEQGEKTVVQYKEEPTGQPNALRAWFYAGEKAGLEFVYPKKRAVQLAAETHEYVPAMVTEVKPEELATAPMTAITPEGKEEAVEQAYEEPKEVAQALPKTASPIPLIALIGGGFVAVGFALRRFARER